MTRFTPTRRAVLVSTTTLALALSAATGCSNGDDSATATTSSSSVAPTTKSTGQGGITPLPVCGPDTAGNGFANPIPCTPAASTSSRPCADENTQGEHVQAGVIPQCTPAGNEQGQPGFTSPNPPINYTVSTATGTATVGIRNNSVIAIRPSDRADPSYVLVPVTIDVTDGRVELGPTHWHLHTTSAQDIPATPTSGIAIAIGTATFDGRAQAVVPFTANTPTNGALTAGAQIANITLDADDGTELARWVFPTPLSVRELPASN